MINLGVYVDILLNSFLSEVTSVFLRNLTGLAAILFCSCLAQSAEAQDIGLYAEDAAYLSLGLSGSHAAQQSMYTGHVTKFEESEGFSHFLVSARVSQGGILSFDPGDSRDLLGLQSEYSRTKIALNTAWVASQPCGKGCYSTLSGATWRTDRVAAEFLKYYEKNIDTRSQSVSNFIAYSNAKETLCHLGISDFCTSMDQIGIVMEQSQVGAAQLVAAALKLDTGVATFSLPKFHGAMVSTSPEVISAVYRTMGPSLQDEVLDFNEWQIVPAASETTPGLHLINLNISSNPQFFKTISDASGAIREINSQMKDFFRLVSSSKVECSYGSYNSNPYFNCYIHSNDLGIPGTGAWIKTYAVMTPYQLADQMVVVINLYFTRKFDKKSTPPRGEFYDLDYNNADEARFAQLATARVAGAFLEFFQPHIEIRR